MASSERRGTSGTGSSGKGRKARGWGGGPRVAVGGTILPAAPIAAAPEAPGPVAPRPLTEAQMAGRSAVAAIRERLAPSGSFPAFQDVSLRFRRGLLDAPAYYSAAVAMLEPAAGADGPAAEDGDTLLCRLALTLPPGPQQDAILAARRASRGAPEAAAPSAAAPSGHTELSCPMCYTDDVSVLLNPLCGHPLCAPCLRAWSIADPEAATRCPVCREPLTLHAPAAAEGRSGAAEEGGGSGGRRRRKGRRGPRVGGAVTLEEALGAAGAAASAARVIHVRGPVRPGGWSGEAVTRPRPAAGVATPSLPAALGGASSGRD